LGWLGWLSLFYIVFSPLYTPDVLKKEALICPLLNNIPDNESVSIYIVTR